MWDLILVVPNYWLCFFFAILRDSRWILIIGIVVGTRTDYGAAKTFKFYRSVRLKLTAKYQTSELTPL